mmetsp:Transcript_18473/g.60445  ORF Transcript_18473/g.60445 Transcript_18473/m.60445 type:complete len:128 (+) Transcript_18473:758-1141(+)
MVSVVRAVLTLVTSTIVIGFRSHVSQGREPLRGEPDRCDFAHLCTEALSFLVHRHEAEKWMALLCKQNACNVAQRGAAAAAIFMVLTSLFAGRHCIRSTDTCSGFHIRFNIVTEASGCEHGQTFIVD